MDTQSFIVNGIKVYGYKGNHCFACRFLDEYKYTPTACTLFEKRLSLKDKTENGFHIASRCKECIDCTK